MWKRLLAASFTLLSLSAVAAVAQNEQRVALVVGNSKYLSVAELRSPKNDAAAMAAMLRRAGFDVIEQENVSRDGMIQATRTFAGKLTPGGVGLLFYAGHAIQAQGVNYLVPIDATLDLEDDLTYETVNLQDILGTLADARLRVGIVILDASRDNPFSAFRSGFSGLASINPPASTVIASAAPPGKVAGDESGDRDIFTAAFLQEAIKPDNLPDVLRHVADAVGPQTGGRQTPWTNSSFHGDFYFTAPPVPAQQPFVADAQPVPDVKDSKAGSAPGPKHESVTRETAGGQKAPELKDIVASVDQNQTPSRVQPAVPAAGAITPPRLQPLPPPETATAAPPTPPSVQPSSQPSAAAATPPVPRKPAPRPTVAAAPEPSSNGSVATAPPSAASHPVQEAMTRPQTVGGEQPLTHDRTPPPEAAPPPASESAPEARLCKVTYFRGIQTAAGAYVTIRVGNTTKRCGLKWLKNPYQGNEFALSLSKSPHHGSVAIEGSGFYYTPEPGFVGDDDFGFVTSPPGSVKAAVIVVAPATSQR